MNHLNTPAQDWAWLAGHWRPVVIGAAVLLGLVLVVLIRRAIRRGAGDKLAVRVAVALASAFSAQGMFEVATQRLHQPWWLAGGLFTVAEAAMLAEGIRAHRTWQATSSSTEPGTLGPHGRMVWAIATVAGVVVSLNAHSPSEYLLRLCMPLLVAGLWRLGYATTDPQVRREDAVAWRWTPRRLGIALGLVEPGERDVATVHRERRVRQLTAHAHGLHQGPRRLRAWHTLRLRRLTLLADDTMVTEVQARVDRVHHIVTTTAPTDTPSSAPAGRASGAPGAHRAGALQHATERGSNALTGAVDHSPERDPAGGWTAPTERGQPRQPRARKRTGRARSDTDLATELAARVAATGPLSVRAIGREFGIGTKRAKTLLTVAGRSAADDTTTGTTNDRDNLAEVTR